MPKIIKEIIIILLVILASMLIFAVLLYDYIPNRIQSKESVTYTATDSVKSMLQDSVAKETENIILTYEVTGTDLNSYEKAKEYVPGKQNPFAEYKAPVDDEGENEGEGEGSKSTSSTKSTSSSKSSSTSSTSSSKTEENTNTSSSYFKKTGTK